MSSAAAACFCSAAVTRSMAARCSETGRFITQHDKRERLIAGGKLLNVLGFVMSPVLVEQIAQLYRSFHKPSGMRITRKGAAQLLGDADELVDEMVAWRWCRLIRSSGHVAHSKKLFSSSLTEALGKFQALILRAGAALAVVPAESCRSVPLKRRAITACRAGGVLNGVREGKAFDSAQSERLAQVPNRSGDGVRAAVGRRRRCWPAYWFGA